ncbi:hypothetical protein ACFL4L_02870 [bacterium]
MSMYLGKQELHQDQKTVKSEIVTVGKETFTKISNVNMMPPFFMSIVSDSDCWMFISSSGALTAGRRNPDQALFPYYTDDRIHDMHDISGSKTIILVKIKETTYLWEPFSQRYEGAYEIERNLYKNIIGNQLIFEERNIDLSVSFQYAWLNSDVFGWIKRSRVINHSSELIDIQILDGIQNILPYGVDQKFQLEYSTLLDGYKKNELLDNGCLALYTVSSIPTDKAEPSEALKATTVWSTGLNNSNILLSTRQMDRFRRGLPVTQETDIRAARGAFLLQSEFELKQSESKTWYIVADLNKDHTDVVSLTTFLSNQTNLVQQIEDSVQEDSRRLLMKVAQADGLQLTRDVLNTNRHFSNSLFNIMRGGVFDNNYAIDKSDFLQFIQITNKSISEKYQSFLNKLPDSVDHHELVQQIKGLHDPDFEKLSYEYLPLTFSRRHGDPSRPWNRFSIDIKNEQGEKVLNYQGNWRDIFQNWEALAISFPSFIESMIVKFVNASTADGYNPYRVTRDGFDWEVLDPSDTWSYIGYWGDHQIIYLLKLLELSEHFHPAKLQEFLLKTVFTYANVPYRIRSYHELIKNPQETIDFNFKLNNQITLRVETLGTDGKFVINAEGNMVHVNLSEKLLVALLSKLSNFVPEAGIWMNTQRPEWNDANNALVGNGCSMVTLYYLRRFITFYLTLLNASEFDTVNISIEVIGFFNQILETFQEFINLLNNPLTDKNRKEILDRLGNAGSDYRNKLYHKGFSNQQNPIFISDIILFLEITLKYIDHSIQVNQRDDHLFHAYNLIKIDDQSIEVRYLYEMLEGQVAVLNSGFLSFEESILLLRSLRKSKLFREDQNSYLLYPDRTLPRFMDKNKISKHQITRSKLLTTLVKDNNKRLIIQDKNGQFYFNGNLRNARMVYQLLDTLKETEYNQLIEKERRMILDLYESTFDHQSFTGRSGTFYKYEGLGSIYWHMVSKLLLAVQDTYYRALDSNAEPSILNQLKDYYYDIREGIGVHKSPELYGAFSTDPYSHTPGFSGVQQPGMTGQVKEDILSRFGELGVLIRNGKIEFNTNLLNAEELLIEPQTFQYFDVHGKAQSLMLSHDTLAFTLCQVPIIYIKANENKIHILKTDGSEQEIHHRTLDLAFSQSIFERRGGIQKINVFFKQNNE